MPLEETAEGVRTVYRAQRLIAINNPAFFETKLWTVAFRSPSTPMEQELASQLKLRMVISSPLFHRGKSTIFHAFNLNLPYVEIVDGSATMECFQSSTRTDILAAHSKQNRGPRVICGREDEIWNIVAQVPWLRVSGCG
jgi:hypothetical protein